jgi:hypothetical protein
MSRSTLADQGHFLFTVSGFSPEVQDFAYILAPQKKRVEELVGLSPMWLKTHQLCQATPK